MELTSDTLPELQPIFTYLNSHGNKLYQEGYFLKLDDQNTRMWKSDEGLTVTDMYQRAARIAIEHGPSASRNSSEPFCHFGMPPNST